ncbi:hypothetical protein [Nitrosarchaeum sp. AC2]|uniref:hypothetical protein n=1 Tax=Nitrosarchaeum sp. AC2 TaxID=2259673 RepID=UPI0015C8DC75|nr:hypothetical protein [Nitrosarchaeum sp. AC2]QLH11103.1 hypothetical protein DSQ20_06205 [Nitrosarchaeum sp. AC2]
MLRKTLFVMLFSIMITVSISSSQSYAETDTKFTKIQGNDLENNPITKNILKNIEIARKQFAAIKEKEQKENEYQKHINEQRIAAQASLDQAVTRMNDAYEEFTPRNAFAKYVSGFNATHQAIYWDQFDYLNAKITLAKDARDTVLKNGGTYFDAMKEYSKYAKMTKVEMLNVIKDLNIKHNFTDKKTQSYFDANGKLPRVENDLNAPCYNCKATITKVKASATETTSITAEKLKPISQSDQIVNLKNKLSEIQKDFVSSKNIIEQKKMVQDMNNILKQIQESGNS